MSLYWQSQTKSADSAQSHQQSSYLLKGAIYCLAETKDSAQEISQIWARWSLIQVSSSPSPSLSWHSKKHIQIVFLVTR